MWMNTHGQQSSGTLSKIKILNIIIEKIFGDKSLNFGVIGGLKQSKMISQLFQNIYFNWWTILNINIYNQWIIGAEWGIGETFVIIDCVHIQKLSHTMYYLPMGV